MSYRLTNKTQRLAARYRPQGYTEKIEREGLGVVYHTPDKLRGIAYKGSAGNPSWHYTYSKPERFDEAVNNFFDGLARWKAEQATRREQQKARRCATALDVWEKARRGEYLGAADVAVCIRAVLGSKYSGVKFSVTSENFSGGNAVNVSWTDGPNQDAVNRILETFTHAGFDGSIDLKYSVSRWLYRDGTMSLARSEGTEGSRGYCSEAIGSPKAADAVLVHGGADYVHGTRRLSLELQKSLAERIFAWAQYTGPMPGVTEYGSLEQLRVTIPHHMDGGKPVSEDLGTMVWRLANGHHPLAHWGEIPAELAA